MRKIFLTLFLVLGLTLSAQAEVRTLTEESGAYKLTYPAVVTENAAAQQRINTDILKCVREYKREVRFGKPAEENTPRAYTGFIDYKVVRDDEKLLSLLLYKYRYTGGAHGTTVVDGLVYDKQNGVRLPLEKFLRITPEELREEVTRALYTLEDGQLIAKEGYWPQELTKVPQDYYIDKDGTVGLIFQQYEIAPYAAGITVARLTAERAEYYNRIHTDEAARAQQGVSAAAIIRCARRSEEKAAF